MPKSLLASYLDRFARLLGRSGALLPGQIEAQAAALPLSAEPLTLPAASIFWDDGPALPLLHELPRGALSGPMQDDKARAHAALSRLVRRQVLEQASLDLRQVDGLCVPNPLGHPCERFEAFATHPRCRSIRIISHTDFVRTLNRALPGFQAGPWVELRQAGWLGPRLFWSGEQQAEAFACAIAYARLRQLAIPVPCRTIHYRLEIGGLLTLESRYHLLSLPRPTWEEQAFMNLLVEGQIPYSRLRLGNRELLILDREHPLAEALGQGLKAAGAADFIDYLHRLLEQEPSRTG